MSDMEKRDAVLEEFCPQRYRESPWQTIRKLAAEDMADEIVRLRQRAERAERILAALREPSGRVFMAMFTSFHGTDRAEPLSWALRAAVAAAEQEVGRE